MGMADLDDLVNQVRYEQPKRLFKEAVACYQAGAYRSCIVSTWIALVFDYFEKLSELSVSGNGQARDIVARFGKAHRDGDFRTSQREESELVTNAVTKFDLLSPIEAEDLKRLQNDRNRCAHPSQISAGDAYSPSAELARTHMRHAVLHMLSRPPLQGPKELDRIWGLINSPLFPEDPAAALNSIKEVLVRPRSILVRGLVEQLLWSLTRDGPLAHGRHVAALRAIEQAHPQLAGEVATKALPRIAVDTPDDCVGQLVRLCAEFPWAHRSLGDTARAKIEQLLSSGNDTPAKARSICLASTVAELHDLAMEKVQQVSAETLRTIAREQAGSFLMDEVVRRLEATKRYDETSALRDIFRIPALESKWTENHLDGAVRALGKNGAVQAYGGFHGLVTTLLGHCQRHGSRGAGLWQSVQELPRLAKPEMRTVRQEIEAAYPMLTPVPDEAGPPRPSDLPPMEPALYGPQNKPVEDHEDYNS